MSTVVFVGLRPNVLPVAAELKRRGFTTIIFDVDPIGRDRIPTQLRPMFEVVDRFVTVPGWNEFADLGRRAADLGQIGGVYTTLDEAKPAEAYLRQLVGLPTASPAVLRRVIDKRWVRQELIRRRATRLRAVFDGAIRRLRKWPFRGKGALLKKSHGAGSLGVHHVTSLAELSAAFETIRGRVAETESLARFVRDARGWMGYSSALRR